MSNPLGEAVIPIRASLDKLDKDLADAKSKMSTGLASLGALGLTAAATALAAVGTAAVVAGKEIVNMAMDFDKASDAIIKGTGASGEQLAEMEEIAKNLKSTFGGYDQDFEKIGAVVAEVNTRLGLTGEGLEDFSDKILKFSKLTGGDAVEQTQLITRLMGDWGVETENSAEVMDQLFGAGQNFGIGVDQLAAKMVQFGAPLRQMGFSMEESIAMFGKWEKEGVNTELVLGSLRIAAGKFAKENIDLKEGLDDTIDRIQNAATDSEGLAIAMEVFGARAGPDMAAAIREGRFALDEAIAAMQNTAGAVDDAAARVQDFDDLWGMMKNQALTALLPIGEAVLGLANEAMPVLQEMMAQAQPILEDFATTMAEKLGPAAREIWDAMERIAAALRLTNEETSTGDVLLKGLEVTLDLIVFTVDLLVYWFDNLAWGIEQLMAPVNNLIDAWDVLKKKFSETKDKLPDWLIPGSPTPLEMGVRGLTGALNQMPDFSDKFGGGLPGVAGPAFAAAGSLGGGGASTTTIVNIDGVSAMSTGGEPADEAIRLTLQLLRSQLRGR